MPTAMPILGLRAVYANALRIEFQGGFVSESGKATIWRCGRSLLSFQCSMDWSTLEETDDPAMRLCKKCSEPVYLCETPESFAAHAKAKNCVAIPSTLDIPDAARPSKPMLGRPAPWSYEINEASKKFWMDLEREFGELGPQFTIELDRKRLRIIPAVSEFEIAISALTSLNLRTGDFVFCTNPEWSAEQVRHAFNKARGNQALNCYGVYVIYGISIDGEMPIYVGLSGTVHNDGSMGNQCLHKRLGKKQDNKSRPQFFHEFIHLDKKNRGPFNNGLHIRWIETYRDSLGTPPFLAEAQLLAAYLKDFGRLPLLNKEV